MLRRFLQCSSLLHHRSLSSVPNLHKSCFVPIDKELYGTRLPLRGMRHAGPWCAHQVWLPQQRRAWPCNCTTGIDWISEGSHVTLCWLVTCHFCGHMSIFCARSGGWMTQPRTVGGFHCVVRCGCVICVSLVCDGVVCPFTVRGSVMSCVQRDT